MAPVGFLEGHGDRPKPVGGTVRILVVAPSFPTHLLGRHSQSCGLLALFGYKSFTTHQRVRVTFTVYSVVTMEVLIPPWLSRSVTLIIISHIWLRESLCFQTSIKKV